MYRLSRGSQSLTITTAALAVMALAAPSPAQAQLLYEETFSNNVPGSNISLSNAGWFVHATAAGTNLTAMPDIAGVSFNNGAPDPAAGYAFAGNFSPVNEPYLFWTDEFLIDQTLTPVDSISFYMGNVVVTDGFRVALRVGAAANNEWYASDTLFTGPEIANGSLFSSLAQQQVLTLPGATFKALDFVPGVSLNYNPAAASVSLPGSAPITAFGQFAPTRTGIIRFDTYAVNATASASAPEPGTFALIAVGVMAPAYTRRRRETIRRSGS